MLKRLKWNHVIMSVLYIALGIFCWWCRVQR